MSLKHISNNTLNSIQVNYNAFKIKMAYTDQIKPQIITLILHLSVCESGRSREAIRPELKRFPSRWTWTLHEAAY